MPGKDGMGPPGDGGRGTGGGGNGQNTGKGRMGGMRAGAGPGGDCVCPQCGVKAPHTKGIPCNSLTCPQCGAKMVRG